MMSSEQSGEHKNYSSDTTAFLKVAMTPSDYSGGVIFFQHWGNNYHFLTFYHIKNVITTHTTDGLKNNLKRSYGRQ